MKRLCRIVHKHGTALPISQRTHGVPALQLVRNVTPTKSQSGSFSILTAIENMFNNTQGKMNAFLLKKAYPNLTAQEKDLIECIVACSKIQDTDTTRPEKQTLDRIQDAAHMLRHYTTRYRQKPSQTIAARNKTPTNPLSATYIADVQEYEANVQSADTFLQTRSRLVGLPIDAFASKECIGKTTFSAANTLVLRLVKRKRTLESAVPHILTTNTVQRVIRAYEAFAKFEIMQAQEVDAGAKEGSSGWQHLQALEEVISLERGMPDAVKLDKPTMVLLSMRLWPMQKLHGDR